MDILLINPPAPCFTDEARTATPPLGLAYIAAVLLQHGFNVKILDCVIAGLETESALPDGALIYGLPMADLQEQVRAYHPHVVGISCVFSISDGVVRAVARAIRAVSPESKIVIGGTHATVMAETLIREPEIDFVIRGEGEYAFLKLVEFLRGERPVDEVPNLTRLEAGVVCSSPQQFIEDIDTLPFPARHLLDMEAYIRAGRMQGLPRKGLRATNMITSRGCPADCVFCSIHCVWGYKFRGHSPEYVLQELRILKADYGINHVLFEDDNLTYDRARARRLFAGMLAQELDFTWTAPNGVAIWALDEDLLRLIRQSGCSWLSIAVESGDPDTLHRIIRKPLKLERVTQVIQMCKRLGIRTTAFFVLGLPGETQISMQRSMQFAERLAVDSIVISVAAPYPGTRLYDICQAAGYLPADFQIGNLTTRVGQIQTPEFAPPDVERLINRTLLRRAFRHPWGTLRRIWEKFQLDPRAALGFIAHRLAGGFTGRRTSSGYRRAAG